MDYADAGDHITHNITAFSIHPGPFSQISKPGTISLALAVSAI